MGSKMKLIVNIERNKRENERLRKRSQDFDAFKGGEGTSLSMRLEKPFIYLEEFLGI